MITEVPTALPPKKVEVAPLEDPDFLHVHDSHNHSHNGSPRPMTPGDRRVRVINLGAIIIPFIGLGTLIWLSWGTGFDWTQFGIMWVMGLTTAVGVTVGYHRLFTHKAFVAPAAVRYALAAMGSMAVEGPVIEWAATHRRHHQHSDEENDPHSPHMHAGGSWGDGIMDTLRGFAHAHCGWLIEGRQRGTGRYVIDLRADRVLVAASSHFKLWVLIGLVAPAVMGGLITMSFWGAFLGFMWGGLARIFVVHHVTWSINSICHLWGTQPFRTHDESRNNALLGVLALGEGWHNNHHAFPSSARHGLRWWEIDMSYMIIRTLGFFGLARDIRVPSQDRMDEKLKTNER